MCKMLYIVVLWIHSFCRMLTSMVVDLTLGTGTCVISGQNKGLVDSTGIDSTYFKLESQDKRPQIHRWRTYDSHRLAMSQVIVKEVHWLSENIIYSWRGGLPADLQGKFWECLFLFPTGTLFLFSRRHKFTIRAGNNQSEWPDWPKHITQAEENGESGVVLPYLDFKLRVRRKPSSAGSYLRSTNNEALSGTRTGASASELTPGRCQKIDWCLLTRPAWPFFSYIKIKFH